MLNRLLQKLLLKETSDAAVERSSAPPVNADSTVAYSRPERTEVWSVKAKAQALVSVFETGKVGGDYSAIALLPDGAGVSYGKHQATDAGGNLDQILLRYADLGGMHSAELSTYLDRLEENATAQFSSLDEAPPWVVGLVELLKKAGRDPTMQEAQRQIFDEQYWQPCKAHCESMELELPLSWAVVYDTCIHSGPAGVANIRRKFSSVPPSRGGLERDWTTDYVRARRNWLASYGPEGHIVRRTVVRMDVFLSLIDQYNWELDTPIVLKSPYNVVIEDSDLA